VYGLEQIKEIDRGAWTDGGYRDREGLYGLVEDTEIGSWCIDWRRLQR